MGASAYCRDALGQGPWQTNLKEASQNAIVQQARTLFEEADHADQPRAWPECGALRAPGHAVVICVVCLFKLCACLLENYILSCLFQIGLSMRPYSIIR